jgi:hypothetical protein
VGCAFNCVVVPPEIQKVKDLKKFYEEYKNSLLEQYGEDFEGYSGDMAVDDGYLVIKKTLELESKKDVVHQEELEEYWSDLLRLCTGHCEKWGPSIAVRLGKQWVICGSYSD